MKPRTRRWRVSENHRTIHVIDIDLPHVGDEQDVLFTTDAHWDNPHCDRDLLSKHLGQARERDAPVLDNGDWFCAMQGAWDPRKSKNDLRPEHQRADYLDALVSTSADYLRPYLDLLTIRAKGNHETAITKRHETDLTERLVERLRTMGASNVFAGGYSGFVVFRIRHAQTRIRPFKLFYHHGYGGGGPVTRGTIQTNRMAVFLADADIVFTGHTHDSWRMPIARVRLNSDCTKIEHTRQEHVRGGGYKEEYRDGHGGWHVERGGAPKPKGAWWIKFRYDHHRDKADGTEITYDLVEAL